MTMQAPAAPLLGEIRFPPARQEAIQMARFESIQRGGIAIFVLYRGHNSYSISPRPEGAAPTDVVFPDARYDLTSNWDHRWMDAEVQGVAEAPVEPPLEELTGTEPVSRWRYRCILSGMGEWLSEYFVAPDADAAMRHGRQEMLRACYAQLTGENAPEDIDLPVSLVNIQEGSESVESEESTANTAQ